MARLLIIFVALSITHNLLASASKSYAFKELRSKICNNSCTLNPFVGKPFDIEFNIQKMGDEETGFEYFANIKLNGKNFGPLRVPPSVQNGRLPFHQEIFFEKQLFQIFSLDSSKHVSTGYHYYFIRNGDTFHLLGKEPFATLFYNNTGKSDNDERFYVLVGYGRGNYVRQDYKLDGNRLVEVD